MAAFRHSADMVDLVYLVGLWATEPPIHRATEPPSHDMETMDAPALSEQKVLTGKRRWIALAFLALGVAMIILDATVVNVAIPSMIKDLNLTTNDAEWINAAYSLT
ncbi:MAG: hypothetical protein CK552_03360, partial [Actinobacteria bacterium]